MMWYSEYKTPEGFYFIIDQDENVGFYLYVYETPELFRKDVEDPQRRCAHHQRDYLQDTLHWAKHQAFEEFGVPMDSWVEAS